MGVVYTPNEIVRFMVESADWLCEKHFGKSLIDRDVQILDPATGTGTFICELLEHFRGQKSKLEHKYKEELHANEVAILPYYVANLNIEATYATITGEYAEFPNLCFVDTLDNVGGLGIRSGYQHDLFGAMSEENVARIKRQNARKISVVIGNPPYNANQQNENDNNKNRTYPRIDERIKNTYIKLSKAQKTKAYDMYTRFFRWASDRLHDDGILAFITNRSFVDSRTMDGFRRAVAKEFSHVYVVDLGGDVRANPKLSGTRHNVFGIQTGVAISFLVKRRLKKGEAHTCSVHYSRRPEMETAEDKLSWLEQTHLSRLSMDSVRPDAKGNWINQTDNDFDKHIAIASKATKSDKSTKSIFQLFSLGIVTNRDEWVYGEDPSQVERRVQFFIERFNSERKRWIEAARPKAIGDFVARDIKWTSELEVHLKRGTTIKFDPSAIVQSQYRPFVRRWTYFAPVITHRPYQNFNFFPTAQTKNVVLAVAVEERVPFSLLASNALPNKDIFIPSAAQCFARFRYTEDGRQVDNITDWALKQFQSYYKEASKSTRDITKDSIFQYVYGVLHDPIYRERYKQNLKREFPRIPLYPDFWKWAGWGEKLLTLHIDYAAAKPWDLKRVDAPDSKSKSGDAPPKPSLKANKDIGVIVLDTETQLTGVPSEAWDYRLGNRSAIEWILDQAKEKTPKDPTIRANFNTYRFADYKEKVIDLLMRVTRVSVETMQIVEAMKMEKR
ncbi:type ISP restriction/modification enzyme [Bradyrhizobium yuanmingense]|uniref:type ISP restriction/modification enzyme n=1 Tax=Bradyrhizobium yuanmingense TaxID=108015 RepID=UPI001FD8A7EE|nr:type ISP restriction/modification enzyme [Bradyrhizobium yuanmingense]